MYIISTPADGTYVRFVEGFRKNISDVNFATQFHAVEEAEGYCREEDFIEEYRLDYVQRINPARNQDAFVVRTSVGTYLRVYGQDAYGFTSSILLAHFFETAERAERRMEEWDVAGKVLKVSMNLERKETL